MAYSKIVRPMILQPSMYTISDWKEHPPGSRENSSEDFFFYFNGNPDFSYWNYIQGDSNVRIDWAEGRPTEFPLPTDYVATAGAGFITPWQASWTAPGHTTVGSWVIWGAGVYRYGPTRAYDSAFTATSWPERGGGAIDYYPYWSWSNVTGDWHDDWCENLPGNFIQPELPGITPSSFTWRDTDQYGPYDPAIQANYRDWQNLLHLPAPAPGGGVWTPGVGSYTAYEILWSGWEPSSEGLLTSKGSAIPVDRDGPVTLQWRQGVVRGDTGDGTGYTPTGIDFAVEIGLMPMRFMWNDYGDTEERHIPPNRGNRKPCYEYWVYPDANYFQAGNFIPLATTADVKTADTVIQTLSFVPSDYAIEFPVPVPGFDMEARMFVLAMRPRTGPLSYPTTKNVVWNRGVEAWIDEWKPGGRYRTASYKETVVTAVNTDLDAQGKYRIVGHPSLEPEEVDPQWSRFDSTLASGWVYGDGVACTKKDADLYIPSYVREIGRSIHCFIARWSWPNDVWSFDHSTWLGGARGQVNADSSVVWGQYDTDRGGYFFGGNFTVYLGSGVYYPLHPTVYTEDWEEISVDVEVNMDWITTGNPITHSSANDWVSIYLPEPMTGWVVFT